MSQVTFSNSEIRMLNKAIDFQYRKNVNTISKMSDANEGINIFGPVPDFLKKAADEVLTKEVETIERENDNLIILQAKLIEYKRSINP